MDTTAANITPEMLDSNEVFGFFSGPAMDDSLTEGNGMLVFLDGTPIPGVRAFSTGEAGFVEVFDHKTGTTSRREGKVRAFEVQV